MHIPTDNQGLDHQDIALLRVVDKFETTSRLLLPVLDNVQLGKQLTQLKVAWKWMLWKMFTAPLLLKTFILDEKTQSP